MKKLPISGFDIGAIIAAVVIALLGGGAWWYLSGALQDAQAEDASAKSDYDKYSTKYDIVVSPTNGKVLQGNIDLLKVQLDPLIKSKLLPKENKLSSIDKKDPVAWKHDLDDEVHALNAAAKAHGVTVPPNFYFGFSRYVNQSPGDDQTAVLSKQMLGIQELSNILINAPVKDIQAIRRTYEEDPHITGSNSGGSSGGSSDSDHLGANALVAPAGAYTDYPFEVEFETTPENLRPVVDNLIQSPYLFIIRTMIIENSIPDSPKLATLDQIAGAPAPSVVDSSPGAVASTQSTLGPQKFFGYSTLKIKARIDMIEWSAKDK
jgi:hypothetical protein